LLSISSSHSRPVRLRLCGQSHELEFSCPDSAARWIDEAQQEIDSQTQADSLGVLHLHRIPFLVPAAIAFHLRANAQTPWLQRNIFAAAAFARLVVQCPRRIVKMQADRSACQHRQTFAAWEEFHASPDKTALPFIHFVSKPLDERILQSEVAALGGRWVCVENEQFWSVFEAKSGVETVITFRGGDGGKDDQFNHPGSPLRAFIHGVDPESAPLQPLSILKSLVRRRSCDVPQPTVTIVAYSMGCLPALACALAFGASDELPLVQLSRVILFNPATMFWPLWLRPPLLPSNWWSHAPPASNAIVAYVVKDDPLSDGVPGPHGFRAPLSPGCTVVLPPKFCGPDMAKNHSLDNFV
jgi:hypothetical protein